MSKKLIKDLKVGDVCFFILSDSATNIVHCQSIEKKKSCGENYYDLVFVTEYNSLLKTFEFGNSSYCGVNLGSGNHVFVNKEDALDYINILQSNCEDSKKLINEY